METPSTARTGVFASCGGVITAWFIFPVQQTLLSSTTPSSFIPDSLVPTSPPSAFHMHGFFLISVCVYVWHLCDSREPGFCLLFLTEHYFYAAISEKLCLVCFLSAEFPTFVTFKLYMSKNVWTGNIVHDMSDKLSVSCKGRDHIFSYQLISYCFCQKRPDENKCSCKTLSV